MAKCIYCLKDENETTFNSKEHVMPKGLGRFNGCPTIKGDIVCDNCNSLFSQLEVRFIEDTYEGIFSQRLGLGNRGSVTFRDENFKIETITGFGEGFFKEMFPFLQFKDGKYVPIPRNQIKIKRKSGGYRVFSPESLRELVPGTRKFSKTVSDLKNLHQKDMAIFAETHEEVADIIKLLHTLGVKYKEKESHYKEMKPSDQVFIEEEYKCIIIKDLGRVLTKIAFNYFAYCTKQSGLESVLYTNHFDAVRNYIHAGDGELKQFIPAVNEKPFLLSPERKPVVVTGHLIAFLEENGRVYARMNFFGLPAIYKIKLGSLPRELNKNNFGCGHAFIPFEEQSIFNLSQTEPEAITEDQIKLSFGLFKRG